VSYDDGFRIACCHPDLPAHTVDDYHPVGETDAILCDEFEDGDALNRSMEDLRLIEDAEEVHKMPYLDALRNFDRVVCPVCEDTCPAIKIMESSDGDGAISKTYLCMSTFEEFDYVSTTPEEALDELSDMEW
jgi:hypothetical protein